MMKKCKILGTAAAMMLVFALAGCENNTDDVDALKKTGRPDGTGTG